MKEYNYKIMKDNKIFDKGVLHANGKRDARRLIKKNVGVFPKENVVIKLARMV